MNFPKQENSDLSNPLRWFDSFIFNNTPYRYREDFFSEARRLHHDNDLKFDIEESSFSYIDFTTEDGAIHRTTFSYSNYLSDIIEVEKTKSIKLLKQKAESIQSTEELEYYLKKIIDQLEYLINLLKEKHNTTIREFECVPKGVYKIVIYLKTAHKSFLPNPLPDIFEEANNPPMHLFSNIYKFNQNSGTASELIGNITLPKNQEIIPTSDRANHNRSKKSPVKAFEWKKEPKKHTLYLYATLKDFKAIDKETDFNKFSLAFSGEEIETPLKIRWLLKSNNNSYKAPLLRMIKFLADIKIIKPYESHAELARKIHQIFVNPKGEEFSGIEMSIVEMGKDFSNHEKELMDELGRLAHGSTDIIADSY